MSELVMTYLDRLSYTSFRRKHMRVLFAVIALTGILSAAPQTEVPVAPAQAQVQTQCCHDHQHRVQFVEIARASQYRAVCSKGDLNAVYSSRSAAVKAAQSHRQRTGHNTSVRKQ